jgi:hypothetical protein
MKKFYLSVLTISLIVFVGFSSVAQENEKKVNPETMKKYNVLLNYQETNEAILKYCDPNFPKRESTSYAYDLQKYAKIHRPKPILKHTGNEEADKSRFESELIRWKKQNSYYPQFIPYSLYQTFFTPEDDVRFYEAALKEWIKSNPKEYEECLTKNRNEEILIEKKN